MNFKTENDFSEVRILKHPQETFLGLQTNSLNNKRKCKIFNFRLV